MRRAVLVLALLGTSLSARAGVAPVIGGHPSAEGAWPDAVAVLFGTDLQQNCTGVLIAPTLVLTAGHCADPQLKAVLIGTNKLSQAASGETIMVKQQIEYPNSQRSEDVTLLILDHATTKPPRTIATGWARFDILNGAPVAIVGWGSTDENAQQYPDAQQEATTTITDADCSTSPGCNTLAQPAGELGAGGMGIDTCPGDSGGPIYLVTTYGTFLLGTTSRGYDNATSYCKDGGIYERADKIVDWIEQSSALTLPRGPMPTADLLLAQTGHPGKTTIMTNDPRATATHTFTVMAPPAHGTATVDGKGVVTYTSMAGYLGDDTVQVMVADASVAGRQIPLTIAVTVQEAPVPGVDDGCCGASRSPSSALAPLALIGLVALRRRRRRVA